MRVLYVARYYPTLSETFVYREIGGLLDRGVEVRVLALGERADGALQDELPAVEVLRPPRGLGAGALLGPAVRGALRGGLPDDVRGWLRPKELARVQWAAEQAAAWGAERVHAHFAGEAGEWGLGVAGLLGVPLSLTVHAVDLFKPRPSLPALLRSARPAITVAEHHARWIAEHHGVRARVVRCGVDPGRYPPAVQDDGPLRVVAVGRWVPKKGLDLLVEAVQALDGPVSLRLVGDAPAEVASDRVRVGPLPPSRVPPVLAGAHLFALPCRIAEDGDRDGIPLALMEAMAAGLPVLTTPVSGIPELVDDQVGWVVAPDDVSAIVRALRAAADAPDERARRGSEGRRRVAERGFTVDAQVEGLLEAWEAG